MMQRSFLAIANLLGAPSLFAQDKQPVPAFDIASIKRAQVGTMKTGSLFYRRINILAVIRHAYNVDSPQIAGDSN